MANFWKNIKSKEFGWKSTYFRRNFVLILFIASIPGIITGICLYWFGIHNIEKELKTIHENQINERANNIHEQLEYLELSLAHWAFDPMYNYSLLDVNFKKEFQTTRDISKSLLILEGSNPIIDKVEFYLDTEEPILFNPNYNLVTNSDVQQFYQGLLQREHAINWNHYNIPTGDAKKTEQLTLTHHIPGISKPPFGEIIITIDQAKLNQLFETLTPYDEGATMLLDSDYHVLLSTDTGTDESFIESVRENVLEQGDNQGALSLEWNDETYSVSYGTMKRINEDWMYISTSPISSITSPIVFISQLVLIISFSGFILAIIMSWFASIKIYNPVKKLIHGLVSEEKPIKGTKDEFELIKNNWADMMKESKQLQKRLADQMPQLKESFLLQLKKGHFHHYSEEKLQHRMKSYGWELDHHQWMLLDIQLTGLHSSERAYQESDYSLVTFTLVNIVEEYANSYFKQFTIINYHNLSIGMFIVAPSNVDVEEKLDEFSLNISNIMNDILKMNVTITISDTTNSVKQIPYLFDEVNIGKKYRNFENKNQIIHLRDWKNNENDFKMFYPFETEKEVIQAVRRGQINETEQLIRKFINELKEKGVQEINIQPGIIQMFSAIQHEVLHSGIHPNELFESRNMFEELSEIRELEWMVNWIIKEVITPYVHVLKGRMDIEMKRIVEHVVQYMEHHYMEDISLDSCAEIVDTNPYSLSKSFKKILHINFIDYLTNLRINKAKELLLNTNMKMNDIAESVGYRHSYFNRIFKKHVGLPPSQYRKMKSSS